jgi:hypothetical protein
MPGLDGNEFENEVRTLMKVAHKNIVRFIGYCSHTIHEYVQHEGIYVLTESSQRLICMEYMVNGSLDKHIHGKLNTASEIQFSSRMYMLSLPKNHNFNSYIFLTFFYISPIYVRAYSFA